MSNQQDPILFNYQVYQQDFQAKSIQWKTQPVTERKCNNVGCVIAFFIIFGLLLAVGIFYMVDANNLQLMDTMAIKNEAGPIVGCMAIAMVLSFLYILLIKVIPKHMVYFLMALSLAMILALAIFAFVNGLIGSGVVVLILFILYGFFLLCYKRKIDLGIIIIKVASTFLTQKWGVFISPIITVGFNILFHLFWTFSIGCIFQVASYKSNNQQDNTIQILISLVWFFMWLFFSYLFYYMMTFTIAVACSFWYYKIEDKHWLTTAYKWLFSSSFGSVVFASFLISIVIFARMLVNSNSSYARNNLLAVFCVLMVQCCLYRLQILIQILNHNSIIVMAVTAQGFIDAAKTTIGLLSRFFPLMAVTDIINNLLVFWGIVIMTFLITIISIFWFSAVGDFGIDVVVAILGSIMVSCLIFSAMFESVSSVFIFYCFDVRFKQMGFPCHNMPYEINVALRNSKFQQQLSEDKPKQKTQNKTKK